MLETLVFQVTTRCPLNCPQCYMEKGKRDLSLTVGRDLIRRLSKTDGGAAVQFTGGEPMAYKDLWALIGYASECGLYSAVATSGLGYSAKLYNELKNSGLSVLCVSINHIDEDKNAFTRDSYDLSMSAIKTACEVGLYCCANVVVTDQNIDALKDLSDRLCDLGVETIALLRPVKSHDGKYIPSLSKETVVKMKELVETNPELFAVENCFKEYWEYTSGDKFICKDAGATSAFINADGTVSPCSQMTKYRYASLEEMQKHRRVWQDECCQ